MSKVRTVIYHKPNIGALKGKIGLSIIETIRNAHKPDHSALEKRVKKHEAEILAAIKDGSF